ncbi:S49 family peptidase [Ancylobacter mangrovi]|uniref:S49 family peptidase n=1 Tax=Ancylobacter mangrovi TaxID=2972472 RepID=UPI002162C671|nr:S49 family peptidase [Ancylobacter mangrovi]MCS0501386.1 S49 family peptidase [Ancylobacter mangrovi]
MNGLEMALRSSGRAVLMEPRAASALLARLAEGPADHRRAGVAGFAGRLRAALGGSAGRESDGHVARQMSGPWLSWAPDAERRDGYALVDGIAIIDVKGPLTPDGYYDWWDDVHVAGYTDIGAAIRAARASAAVRAILLRVDSCGGLVDGCFELADDIRDGSARNGGKPIWAAVATAYSAAYALASACDRIVAPSTAGVGSIGVLILHYDQSEWLAEIGLKIEAIESAPGKTGGASFKPLAAEARADLQAAVDEIARIFVTAVVAGRGITAAQVQAQNARCFLASHSDRSRSGLALGLVDVIGTERTAASELVALAAPLTTEPGPAPSAPGTMESTMSLKQILTSLLAKGGDPSETLDAVKAQVEAADEQTPTEEEEDGAGAESQSGDGEEEDDGEALASRDPMAVLDLPEARGRSDLARKLARKVQTGALTVADARDMLAAAPKSSRLGTAMAGRDANPGNDRSSSKIEAGWDAVVAEVNERRGFSR